MQNLGEGARGKVFSLPHLSSLVQILGVNFKHERGVDENEGTVSVGVGG